MSDMTDVKIYPNPVSREIRIEFNPGIDKNVDISTINELGQTFVLPMRRNGSIHILDASRLSPGIYVVVISNDKGEVFKEKIVVQNDK